MARTQRWEVKTKKSTVRHKEPGEKKNSTLSLCTVNKDLWHIYMAGWRISEPLSHCHENLDLDTGTAITQHNNNQGGRNERVTLYGITIDELSTFNDTGYRLLINLPGMSRMPQAHVRMPLVWIPCLRTFVTINTETMSPDAL